MKKTCPSCRKRLTAGAFNDSARSPDGLASLCRACTNTRRRARDRSAGERPSAPRNVAAALRTGDLTLMRTLIREGAKPEWDWICEATRGGHFALATMLIEGGVEPNVFTRVAMNDLAGVRRRLKRAKGDARLVANMRPDSQNVTPLHVGCASDVRTWGPDQTTVQIRVAETLLDCGADVNARSHYRGLDDATPLFCACWSSGNVDLVRWLLEHGATADDRDFGAALGHFQRHRRGAYDLAEALLSWGIPVDGQCTDRTPLQAFAHQAQHKTVSWLIAHGADVNARMPGGRTAAHLAAERNTGPTTLALLVEHGADLAAIDEDGRTPLDLAKLGGKIRVVDWIKKRLRRREIDNPDLTKRKKPQRTSTARR